jgi:F0F1-type ATP synthase assembly protein I
MKDEHGVASPGGQPASGKGDKPSPGGEFAGIGLQFALTVVVFALIGVWLDKRLGTAPWFLVGLTFVGAGGGMYSMYRRAVTSHRSRDPGPR